MNQKQPLLDTNLYFRWTPGAMPPGSQIEQWNQIRQCWMPSSREIYKHCLSSGDAIVMNPVWRMQAARAHTSQQPASYVHGGE